MQKISKGLMYDSLYSVMPYGVWPCGLMSGPFSHVLWGVNSVGSSLLQLPIGQKRQPMALETQILQGETSVPIWRSSLPQCKLLNHCFLKLEMVCSFGNAMNV
jgi:hypothetical protein